MRRSWALLPLISTSETVLFHLFSSRASSSSAHQFVLASTNSLSTVFTSPSFLKSQDLRQISPATRASFSSKKTMEKRNESDSLIIKALTTKEGSSSDEFRGRTVPWTVADLFSCTPKMAVAYHVMATSWDILTPMGATLGCLLSLAGIVNQPLFAAAGTVGLCAGGAGIVLGLVGLVVIARKGEAASPPWTPEGIQDRADRLKVNFPVRVLDEAAWLGIAAGGLLCMIGGVGTALGFSKGTFGVVQSMCVGSSVGSILGGICIAGLHKKKDESTPNV